MFVITLFSLFAVATSQTVPKETCATLKATFKMMCSGDVDLLAGLQSLATMTEEETDDKMEDQAKCKPAPVNDYCPLRYKGKCFWVEVRDGQITYQEAKEICAFQGGEPANIYSEDHHYMLLGYSRIFSSKDGRFPVWLGMTYNNKTKTVELRDGTKAPFVKWMRGYPQTTQNRCCQILLWTRMDLSKVHNIFTWTPLGTSDGVICEK